MPTPKKALPAAVRKASKAKKNLVRSPGFGKSSPSKTRPSYAKGKKPAPPSKKASASAPAKAEETGFGFCTIM